MTTLRPQWDMGISVISLPANLDWLSHYFMFEQDGYYQCDTLPISHTAEVDRPAKKIDESFKGSPPNFRQRHRRFCNQLKAISSELRCGVISRSLRVRLEISDRSIRCFARHSLREVDGENLIFDYFRLFQSISACFSLLQSISACFSLCKSVSPCFSLF